MYTKDIKKQLDEKIEKFTVHQTLSKNALINIKELACSLKVAPSYKIARKNNNNQIVYDYINERQYYGNRPQLNANAIYLYLYLHFLNNSDGKVFLVVKDAADYLHIHTKSIIRNLKTLCEKGYILYEKSDEGYDVIINRYDEINKPVQEGGRGYLTMSVNTFDELLNSSRAADINELRLQLRSLLFSSSMIKKDILGNITFKTLKKFFPSYVKIKNLKHMLVTDQTTNICSVTLFPNACRIKLKDQFNPVIQKQSQLDDFRVEIERKFKQLNRKYKRNLLDFNAQVISDIANISLRFPKEIILMAVETLFEKYAYKNISSIGALTRTLTEDIHFSMQAVT